MINVYLANRPPLAEYLNTEVVKHLPKGEIKRIADEVGNHWRKIFNVYAKLVYCLAEMAPLPLLQQFSRWQEYRDQALLQRGSGTALYLNSAQFDEAPLAVQIVMGKAYAECLLQGIVLEWLDKDFAINREQRIIVCPYFDYRQLSNVKIQYLAKLILSFKLN